MKLDTSKIKDFETMSVEDKLKAVLDLDIAESPNTTEIEKLKKALDKANSEAANSKRALQEKMTEAEKAEAERLESDKAIKAELEQLRAEKTISSYKAKYLAMGYDEQLAQLTAEALQKGDTETVFANQKTFQETQRAAIEAEALKKQPNIHGSHVPASAEDKAVAAFRKGALGN